MTNDDYYQPITDTVQNPMADDAQAETDSPANDSPTEETNMTNNIPQTPPPQPTPTSSQSPEEDAELLVKKISDQIAKDLGFEDASDEQKKKILDSINRRVETAVLKAIIANCPEETAKSLTEKIANETISEQDVERVIKENPDLQEKIEEEIGLLYEKMLEESKQVWEGLTEEKDDQSELSQVEQAPAENSEDIPAGLPEEKPTEEEQIPQIEPVTSENQDAASSAPEADLSLADKIKAAGIPIEQKSVAEKIYQMRTDGNISPDVKLNDVPEIEHARRLSEWDWNKAGEVVKELEETEKVSI
jgi:hypothetical protein